MNKSLACLLGAGFSHAAGAPLGKQLFTPNWPIALSQRSDKRFRTVREHYEDWQRNHPEGYPEQYMSFIYTGAEPNAPKWKWVVEYVCAVIASAATPPPSLNRNPRYSNRINRPLCCAIHQQFWSILLHATGDLSVVTTNFDIVIERVLRHRRMLRPPSPGCFYGGLARPQILKGVAQPFSRWNPERTIEMTGTIPIFKLHGSLNWTLEGTSVLVYQDLRPVFRHGGTAAIVPPLPEKTVPLWLNEIWHGAESSLRRSDIWVICGYSMPSYDTEVQRLLMKGGAGRPLTILILDPDAGSLQGKWAALLPESNVICLPGLPQGAKSLEHSLAALIR